MPKHESRHSMVIRCCAEVDSALLDQTWLYEEVLPVQGMHGQLLER